MSLVMFLTKHHVVTGSAYGITRICNAAALRLMYAVFFLTVTGICSEAQTQNLNYYLQQGESNSPWLKDYQNQIRTGALDSLLIRAANRPQVLANGQVLITPNIFGQEYDPAITNGGNYAALVSISQPIFNRKILEPQYHKIELQNQSIGNTAGISRLDLKKSITSQYITAYADYQQLLSDQDVYSLLDAQQDILKKLVQNGIYKQTDYLNFEVSLESQEVAVSQLQMQYRTDVATLNYLCGIRDTSFVLLEEPEISGGIYTGKLNSVFFRGFIIDSLKLINQKALIDARYKPAISWFADAGMQSSQPSTIYHHFGTDFGLNLSVPIYDGKQRKIEYQHLKVAEDTRNNYASFFNRQFDQQRATLFQQLEESENLLTQIKAKLNTAQTLIDMDKKLLPAGDVRITDYIIAINNYLSIKNNLNQANISRLHIINQLNYWNH